MIGVKSKMKPTSDSSKTESTTSRFFRLMKHVLRKLYGPPDCFYPGVIPLQYPHSFERDYIVLQSRSRSLEPIPPSISQGEIRIEGALARRYFEVIREALALQTTGSQGDVTKSRLHQNFLESFLGSQDQVIHLEIEVDLSYLSLPNVTSDPLGSQALPLKTGVVQVGSTRWLGFFLFVFQIVDSSERLALQNRCDEFLILRLNICNYSW